MKRFEWNKEKNDLLLQERGVSFEQVVVAIHEGKLVSVQDHPNKEKYHNQKLYIVEINSYAYLVLFVEDEEKVFLKTIIPSRKATKLHILKKRS